MKLKFTVHHADLPPEALIAPKEPLPPHQKTLLEGGLDSSPVFVESDCPGFGKPPKVVSYNIQTSSIDGSCIGECARGFYWIDGAWEEG